MGTCSSWIWICPFTASIVNVYIEESVCTVDPHVLSKRKWQDELGIKMFFMLEILPFFFTRLQTAQICCHPCLGLKRYAALHCPPSLFSNGTALFLVLGSHWKAHLSNTEDEKRFCVYTNKQSLSCCCCNGCCSVGAVALVTTVTVVVSTVPYLLFSLRCLFRAWQKSELPVCLFFCINDDNISYKSAFIGEMLRHVTCLHWTL